MQQLEEIGARIAAARRARGWTQGELATQVGVSRSAVAQWETGRAGQVTPHAVNAEETAMLRLFRACGADDRQILLRTARRLSRGT
jgi:transcriptional regulator with XRE-family HTH domain